MLCFHAAFSQHRFAIRTQLNARRQAMPFVFRIGLAVSLLVLSVAATPTRTTAQTGRPPANAAGLVQNENDVRVLELGKPIKREIKDGESHSYHITLTAGQFLGVAVEQHGVDVALALYAPDGKKLIDADLDSPSKTQGLESLSWVAESSGIHQLEVRSLRNDAPAGRYEARVAELRASTARDLPEERVRRSLQRDIEEYEQALQKWRSVGDREKEAATLQGLGDAYSYVKELSKSVEYYNQARLLSRAIGDCASEYRALHQMGGVYKQVGEPQKALDSYSEAITLSRARKSCDLRGPDVPRGLDVRKAYDLFVLSSIGGLYSSLQNFRQSISFYNQALSASRALGDRHSESFMLMAIGRSHSALGEMSKALEFYKNALSISREVTKRYKGSGAIKYRPVLFEPIILSEIAKTYDLLGEKQRAISYYQQALPLFRLTESSLEVATLLEISKIYSSLGDRQKAIDYLNRALQLSQSSGSLSYASAKIGEAYEALGQDQKATDYYYKAVTLGSDRESGAGPGILQRLMAIWKKRTNPRLAIFYGKQAVNALQEVRTKIKKFDEETRRSFLKSKEGVYRELADLLISQGRLPEAQQVLGLLKEEEYFEFVRRDSKEGLSLTKRSDLTPEEAEWDKRYREIADQVTAIGRERGELLAKKSRIPAKDERLKELEAKLQVASRAFQQFLDKLAEELAGAKQGGEKVFQLRESQGLMEDLRELGAGAVALYTVVGEEKYRVILVTPDVQKAYEYPIKAADLYRKVFAFREVLEDPKRDPLPLARELYGILVGPLAKDLQGARAETLMWSLDSVLRYIPIAALHDGERYMVERYRNVIFTPASNSRLKDTPSAGWRGLGFGVSKAKEGFSALPAVVEEINGIIREESANGADVGVLPGRVMLDEAFTGASMQAGLRQRYPVVHIASHFQFNPGNETNSFLLLGDGSRMSLAEIKTLPNVFGGVELLTLSACNTASSGAAGADGKEVEGFAVLAQRQGAKAVIASLWPVADASTRLIMQDFYRIRNAQAGTLKAEALRQSQLALLRGKLKVTAVGSEERDIKTQLDAKAAEASTTPGRFVRDPQAPYAHPYFWAPFILIGNWR